MKVWDLAYKDWVAAFRNLFAVVMMFVVPMLLTGIIYLAFGGLSSGQAPSVPVTRVQVVNLDQAQGELALGQRLVEDLKSEGLRDILSVSEIASEPDARAAVDQREAGLAVIIPEGFTAALLAPEGRAAVVLYQDPTLTVGPGIVKQVVQSLVDSFAGAKIAAEIVSHQNPNADGAQLSRVASEYAAWNEAQRQGQGDVENAALLVQAPPQRAARNQFNEIIAKIMAGMLVFSVFYTGAATAETLVREDEQGTLARLFTTPTPRGVILGGKLLAVVLTLIVQLAVLLVLSAVVFDIHWGQPAAILLVAFATVVLASGFGIWIMSLIKNTRQSGPVLGGVLTITALLGGLFTQSVQNMPAFYETVNLFTPHGWAMRGWKLALAGAGLGDMWLPVIVMLGLGVALFVVGTLIFRRRFA